MVGGLEQFSVSPRPLGFGFLGLGLRGLVPGLNNIQKLREIMYIVGFINSRLLVHYFSSQVVSSLFPQKEERNVHNIIKHLLRMHSSLLQYFRCYHLWHTSKHSMAM